MTDKNKKNQSEALQDELKPEDFLDALDDWDTGLDDVQAATPVAQDEILPEMDEIDDLTTSVIPEAPVVASEKKNTAPKAEPDVQMEMPKKEVKKEEPKLEVKKPEPAPVPEPKVEAPLPQDFAEEEMNESVLDDLSEPTTVASTTDHKMAREIIIDELNNLDMSNVPAHAHIFYKAVKALSLSKDIGIDDLTRAHAANMLEDGQMPQGIIKKLLDDESVNQEQLGVLFARAQGHMEIMTMEQLPPTAREIRQELDPKVQMILRDKRVVPVKLHTLDRGKAELHLAQNSYVRDLVLESAVKEFAGGYEFVWHYAAADVCGAYWLTGDERGDVDEGMEAEQLLNRIITTAIDAKSSDIHVDPSMKGASKATIKYRIDGITRPKEVISLEQLERLRVRIENVARMPKVNLNHPNKGAFTRSGFDWRVQIQPHAGRQGSLPRIVIRRLNPDVIAMEDLGYPQYFIDKLLTAAKATNGVIFWTGPTGSGKTESIHSAVVSADPMGRGLSVHTIEDPPEKRVEGYAVQMEIAEGDPSRSGLALLKSSLRADPDVVIFGEVRDGEMAQLVFDAANTGHLVFTTLHTNSAVDSVTRLIEMGIGGYLITYVRGIAAQRLIRRVCTNCRQKLVQPTERELKVLNFYNLPVENGHYYAHNPKGCANCNYTGYRGRIAIAEWLVPTAEMAECAEKGEFNKLDKLAVESGYQPMGYMGGIHLKAGITDVDELQRVVLELAVMEDL